jgi:hypothetical protein
MVESDLPFNRHTARKLMQIARDKRLTNVYLGRSILRSRATVPSSESPNQLIASPNEAIHRNAGWEPDAA